MARVMEVLREDHRNMKRLLMILEGQVKILRDEGLPDYGLLSELVSYCLTYPDLYHHPKEDQIYRRLVRRGASKEQLGDMEGAHEELAALTRRLAEALDPPPEPSASGRRTFASQLESYIRSYRSHIEAEDLIFFPLAEAMLQPDDWKAVDALMKRMDDPIFGDTAGPEFRRLSSVLEDQGQQVAAAP